MTFIFLLLLIPYLVPGLWLARGMYSREVKAIARGQRKVPVAIPAKPKRPEIEVWEMLHISAPRKCAHLADKNKACNCKYRDEWIKLKNQWLDYNEWTNEYGNRFFTKEEPIHSPFMLPIYLSAFFWPIAAIGMYVKGGAENIPDYREIERLEQFNRLDLTELD